MAFKRAKLADHVPFDVESWYPLLKEHTFFTEFSALSVPEAEAIVCYYQHRYNSRQCLTLNRVAVLRELENRMDTIIKTRSQFANGVFIRLSSRSPKDGQPLNIGSLRSAYARELQALLGMGWEDDANTKMIAACKAQSLYWKVTNGREALSLILTSERVLVDLTLALQCHHGPTWRPYSLTEIESKLHSKQAVVKETDSVASKWTTAISFRQWRTDVDGSLEFRCFVNRGQLRAISQYNHYCVFKELEKSRDQLQVSIESYCKRMHALLSPRFESYVIDVAVTKLTTKDIGLVVVELNPFETSTGAALFDWSADRRLLENATAVQLRLRSTPLPRLQEYLEAALPMVTGKDNTSEDESYDQLLDRVTKSSAAHAVEGPSWTCVVL